MTANPDSGATRAEGTHLGDDGPGTQNRGDHLRGTPTASTSVRHDRIRWGAVWTGALTTLAIYLALQLLFFALGWLDLGTDSGTARAVVSGVLALVAFFVGGMATGASALWQAANDGMVNAVVTWAVTVLAILALAATGAGALLGTLADVAAQTGALNDAAGAAANANVDPVAATEAARQTAGWAALALGLTVVASAVGGSIGAKLWPGRNVRDAVRR